MEVVLDLLAVTVGLSGFTESVLIVVEKVFAESVFTGMFCVAMSSMIVGELDTVCS